MVHRDPETGKFVEDGNEMYDDIEVVSFGGNAGVQAGDLGGTSNFTGGDVNNFSGLELLDYDEVVDRNEELHLLEAQHVISVFTNSTETADGTVTGAVEVSADPALTDVTRRAALPAASGNQGDDVIGAADQDDTIDLVGRVLVATGHAPFSDSATGVGGAGSAGEDSYTSEVFPMEMGRFHPRDELFMNGRLVAWNIDDAGIHLQLTGQHTYGVISE